MLLIEGILSKVKCFKPPESGISSTPKHQIQMPLKAKEVKPRVQSFLRQDSSLRIGAGDIRTGDRTDSVPGVCNYGYIPLGLLGKPLWELKENPHQIVMRLFKIMNKKSKAGRKLTKTGLIINNNRSTALERTVLLLNYWKTFDRFYLRTQKEITSDTD